MELDELINKIHYGDCLEVMRKIPNKSIDMILCDLPYGSTACKWDQELDLKKLWEQYERIISDVGSIILFSSGLFTARLMASNLELYKYKFVWVKRNSTNFVHAKNRPLTSHEDILVFSKAPMGHVSLLGSKRMVYNPQGLIEINKDIKAGKGRFGTIAGKRPSHKKVFRRTHTNYPKDVLLEFSEPSANEKVHTSQKPIDLCEYLIKTYTEEGNIVLDNCIGSGTTAVACMNTKRKFIGIELNPEYCKIAQERLGKTEIINHDERTKPQEKGEKAYQQYLKDVKSEGNCMAERCTYKDENGNCSGNGLKLRCKDRKE